MSLADKVRVNTHYTRSINLVRDADSLPVIASYIPTTRALRTLHGIQESLKAEENPRAWSLVGPYGSGKSSFALFLTHLLKHPDATSTKTAHNLLKKNDPALAKQLSQLTKNSEGYCTVLLTGSSESLCRRIVKSLAEKANEIFSHRRGRRHKILAQLEQLANKQEEPSTTEVLLCIAELQDAIAHIGYVGLLIVIDELGKFLEYEARHADSHNIFLLQDLAEHALSSHTAQFSLVVMMHQAFEQYARGLGETLKNEWAKVQGRFETIPFLEATEQVLRVVANAIEHDFSAGETEKIEKYAKKAARVFEKVKALPGTMDEETAADLFLRCYPLHPVTALLLPILCQKVAQNERTLFSYLGSKETNGFQDALQRCTKVGDFIFPWEIYEYFILSQPAILSDHATCRRWAEVVTATERLGDAPDDEGQVLKAVGLLNIVGVQGNFKASKEIIALCLPRKKAVLETLEHLSQKSLIQYRKFSTEYRVWQGSDFDLETQVEEERSKLGRFSLAEKLNSRHPLLPIVARRHTIEKGALRYFTPIFADADSYEQLSKQEAQARIIFFLSGSKDDEQCFNESVCGYFSDLDILVLCHNGEQLREAVGEVLALEEVVKNSQALNSDPVAQREFKDRESAAQTEEDELLARLTDEPTQSHWYWKSKRLSITSKRTLQEAFSSVLDQIYYASPIIKNELINRNKPSAQANAARNKLVIAMLNNEAKEDLGFEKFPAEKSIYRSVLRETQLHVQGKDGKWRFEMTSTDSELDPCNLRHVCQRIEKFLDETEQKPQSFIELNDELLAPPYGVKAGVLPILYLTAMMANQEELAVYENRSYSPYLTKEQVTRFIKRPDEFKLQRFRIKGLNHSIFQEYSKTLFGDEKNRSLLSIARPIAQFIGELPGYTKTTKRGLSKEAQAVRDAFQIEGTLTQLLLEDIPKAIGIDAKSSSSKALSEGLSQILSELECCYAKLHHEMRALLAEAFGLDKKLELTVLREALSARYAGLDRYTIDHEGLLTFIQRLTKMGSSDEVWFENLVMFLGHRQLKKWNDTNKITAVHRLKKLIGKLKDLEKRRIHDQVPLQKLDDDSDLYLLGCVKKGGLAHEELVVVGKKRHEKIKEVQSDIKKWLDSLGDDSLKLAALAEVTDEFLAISH